MTKLLFTLGVITAGLSLGYGLQMAVAAGRLRLPLPLADLRRLLQKVGLLFFMYFSFMATVWIIRIDNLRLVALPAIGLFILHFRGRSRPGVCAGIEAQPAADRVLLRLRVVFQYRLHRRLGGVRVPG